MAPENHAGRGLSRSPSKTGLRNGVLSDGEDSTDEKELEAANIGNL